jgi:TldD protein
MRLRAAGILLAVIGALSAFAGGAGMGTPGPNDDPVLAALKDELARSMKLRMETLEKPYFIAYSVTDATSFEAEASLGALVAPGQVQRVRWLRPEVRVGSYDLDDSEFIGTHFFGMFSRGAFGRPVVFEDDYAALRHYVWLATDETYKGALDQYAEKRAALKNRAEAEATPDFARESPVVALSDAPVPAIDAGAWRDLLRRLSAILRDFPGIQESGVHLRVFVGRKYLVNSEGTAIRQPVGLAVLWARAATQSPDGMPQRQFVAFYARTPEGLPVEKELAERVRGMAQELTRVSSAATVDRYSGPVLFSGQAACELFAQLLVPQLSGQRSPVFEREEMAAMMPRSDLTARLNRPVLPPFLHVVDDPTKTAFSGTPLVGSYEIDDQGVRVAPVTLVQNGVLKTLLMSRRPSKEIAKSNGHGRSMSQGAPGAAIGNLFVRTAEGKATDTKAELLRLCREEGLEWCLWVRVLDQPGLSGDGPSFRSFFRRSGRSEQESVTSPLSAYKVFVKDGREEPVRGLVAGEITLRNLKDIAAAGSDYSVHNRTVSPGGVLGMMAGMADDGSTGIPAAIVAPSVLFRDLEFRRETEPSQKLPVLPKPSVRSEAQ